MVKETIDKKEKTIVVETDYPFKAYKISKHRDHFHHSFIKNENQSMGACLFFNQFNGRKYYPKEITVIEVNVPARKVLLKYK